MKHEKNRGSKPKDPIFIGTKMIFLPFLKETTGYSYGSKSWIELLSIIFGTVSREAYLEDIIIR